METLLENSALSQPAPPITKSCLIIAATGLGKSVIMGGMAKHWPRGRVMVLSHRFELNQQLIQEFEGVCSEQVDLEQAVYHADRGMRHRIVVASVQTLVSKRNGRRRMEKFDPKEFGLVMVDEAHRATAKSYRAVFKHFAKNPHIALVGVTATIDRLDGVGLNHIFNHVSVNHDMGWGIDNGWLVPIKQKIHRLKSIDLDSVSTTKGDLNREQMKKQVERDQVFHEMALPFVDLVGESQGIFFAESVSFARRMVDFVKEYRLRRFGSCPQNYAVSVDGSLSPQDPMRRALVRDFRNGDIRVLVNCAVATEGFNVPAVGVVGIGKMTKSRMRYAQMVGRGSRPLPGVVDPYENPADRVAAILASEKPHCTVLDYVGQSRKHELVCSLDLLYGSEPRDVVRRAKSIAARKSYSGTTMDAIKQARSEIRQERAKQNLATVDMEYEFIDSDSNEIIPLSSIKAPFCPGYLKNKGPTDKQRNLLKALGYTDSQIEQMNPRFASKAIDYAIHKTNSPLARKMRERKKNVKPTEPEYVDGVFESIRTARDVSTLELVGRGIADDKRLGLDYVTKLRPALVKAYKSKMDELRRN